MRIARNAAASVGQVIASSLILFVVYRIILGTLGAERLGIWSVVLATASASRVGELGLSASVTRFVAKHKARGEARAAGYAVQTAALSITALLTPVLLLAYPLLEILFGRLFPSVALGEARTLLPYALISLLLTAVAGVFQSALDGCQRYDQRAILVILGQLLFFFSVLILTPRYGLLGLAWGQIGQGSMLLIVGWLMLRRSIPTLPWLPYQWKRASFREMLGYGLQFQLGSVAMMLFEPLTKALLGKYGGLSSAGYYEMASQFVNKARALILSANEVLVPVTASLNVHTPDPERLRGLYRKNLRLLYFVVLPLYALVAAWAPLLSDVWIGHYVPQFVQFVVVLSLAWSINTFAGPAYFFNLGTGNIVWNTASQIWMGAANAGLGLALGPSYGNAGIVTGMTLALVSGSALVVFGFHREHQLPWRLLAPREALGLVVVALAAAVAGNGIHTLLAMGSVSLRYSVSLLVPLMILAPALWLHPLRPLCRVRVQDFYPNRSRCDEPPIARE